MTRKSIVGVCCRRFLGVVFPAREPALILIITSLLLFNISCDYRYVIRFDGEETKTIDTTCGKIVLSCDSMNYIIYQYYIRVIPKGKVLVQFDNIKVFLNNRERKYEVWDLYKPRTDLDSLYIDQETLFIIAVTIKDNEGIKDIKEIGIVAAEGFLSYDSNKSGFGPFYQPIRK